MASNKRKRDGLDDAPGLARITYHADTRAFERLFKERSLEELEDAVKRKLGLESGAIVRLKQMRSNMLLDLDDDDDFEALRAQALDDTLSTIDIKVTVEEKSSQPSTIQAGDQPQPLFATHAAPTTKKRRITSGDGAPTSTPQVATSGTPEAIEPPKQPAKPESKKRKTVSKDTISMVVPAAPALPPKETEASSVAPKVNGASKGVDEPPKKKPKKTKDAVSAPNGESSKAGELSKAGESSKSSEVLKTNDGILDKTKETDKSVDGASAEATPTPAPKKKPLKSSKSKDQVGRESEAATGGPVCGEEQPSKSGKPKEGKKRSTVKDDAKPKVTKKSEKSKKAATREVPQPSAGKDDNYTIPIVAPQTNDLSDDETGTTTSLAPKKSSKKKSTYQGGVSQPEKQRGGNKKNSLLVDECTVKGDSAASNPTLLDAESWGDLLEIFKLEVTQLQNEKGDSPGEDEPSKKSKESKRVKKSTVPPTQEPTPPTSTEPSIPDDRDTPSSGEEMQSPTGHPCPVCLERPFHVRYNCSIVRQGSDAIQKRLDELRQSDACDNEHLIEELEELLQRCKGSDKASPAPNAPPSPASAPPTNPTVLPPESSMSVDSPVTSTPLPSREESSSATSSDEDEEMGTERAMALPKPSRTNKKVIYGDDVLEAVMRGPAPKLGIPSILRELREEEERESVQLEEDEEEGRGERSRERLPNLEARSSEEDGEDGSQSPSAALTGNRSLRYVGRNNGSEETRLGRKLAGDVEADPSKATPDIPAVSEKVACEKTKGSAKNPSCEHDSDSDVDPIEPAEELAYPSDSYFPEADPIEPGTPGFNKVEAKNHSTPKASSSRRTKTRGGIARADDAGHPVPGSPLVSEGRDMVIPLPEGRKPRKKAVGFSASQEVVGTRRPHSPEPLPSTAPENGKGKAVGRGGKVPKTPAKVPQKTLKMNGTTKKVGAAGRTPSPAVWKTIPDATPSVQLDELLSSSSQVEGNTLTPVAGKFSNMAAANPEDDSRGLHDKERLFDLTASQIPFPYSQYTTPQAPAPASSSDSDMEQEEAHKRPPEHHVRKSTTRAYRSLTELASEASTLFSPSLPTPKAIAGKKNGRKRVEDDDDTDGSSSSSSQSDHAATSTHIPRGRRASSVLPTKKRRGLLAGL